MSIKTQKADERRTQHGAVSAAWAGVAVAFLSLGWTVHKDRHPDLSVTNRLGEQIAALQTSVLILTQSVAPQIYDSIYDSLKNLSMQPQAQQQQTAQRASVQIAQLRKAAIAPDQNRLLEAENAVKQALPNSRATPALFDLGASLVSYRSEAVLLNNANRSCLNLGPPPLVPPRPSDGTSTRSKISFADRTFDLGDVSGFRASDAYAEIVAMRSALHLDSTYHLILIRVRVAYRGGSLDPELSLLEMVGCTFDLKAGSEAPGPKGRELLIGLLGSTDHTLTIPLRA